MALRSHCFGNMWSRKVFDSLSERVFYGKTQKDTTLCSVPNELPPSITPHHHLPNRSFQKNSNTFVKGAQDGGVKS